MDEASPVGIQPRKMEFKMQESRVILENNTNEVNQDEGKESRVHIVSGHVTMPPDQRSEMVTRYQYNGVCASSIKSEAKWK